MRSDIKLTRGKLEARGGRRAVGGLVQASGGCVWRVVDTVPVDYKSIIRWGLDMCISMGLPLTSQTVVGFPWLA